MKDGLHKNVIACREHMRLVSAEAKQAVWATWKGYRDAKIDETREEAMRLYRFACEAVLNEVKDALKKRKAA